MQQSAAGGGLTTQRRSKMEEQARGSRRTDCGSIAAAPPCARGWMDASLEEQRTTSGNDSCLPKETRGSKQTPWSSTLLRDYASFRQHRISLWGLGSDECPRLHGSYQRHA